MMKQFLIQALLFVACQSAHHSIGNTPAYIAVVQERMPGNIMAEDEPGAHLRHFTRWVYVLIDKDKLLRVDSIRYGSGQISFETEQLQSGKPLQVGNAMVTNQPVVLAATPGKNWWKISLLEGNQAFDQSPELADPFMIYLSENGKQASWPIEKETVVAPQERY